MEYIGKATVFILLLILEIALRGLCVQYGWESAISYTFGVEAITLLQSILISLFVSCITFQFTFDLAEKDKKPSFQERAITIIVVYLVAILFFWIYNQFK